MNFTVDMLGEFTIYVDGKAMFCYEGRTRKLWNLLQYLLICRDRMVPQEELIEISHLHGTEGRADNSLKNLIYRLRRILENSDLPKMEYIICGRGSHGWNPEIPVTLDIDIFEQEYHAARAAENVSQEEKLMYYLSAIELYKGEFLPQSQKEDWVKKLSQKFQDMYCNSLKTVYEIFKEKKDLRFMEELCKRSLTISPMNEELCCLYLDLLLYQKQFKEALKIYSDFTKNLSKEYRTPSPILEEQYKEIIKSITHVQADIDTVKNDLREANFGRGAYYCKYEIFKDMYRLLARSVMRTGQSVYLILFTVSDENGGLLTIRVQNAIMRFLQLLIGNSLRRGDVYAQYSDTQYVVMLQSITEENTQKVADRIAQGCKELCDSKKIILNVTIQPLDPADEDKIREEAIC